LAQEQKKLEGKNWRGIQDNFVAAALGQGMAHVKAELRANWESPGEQMR